MTQCERVIQYIKDFGSISTLEAFRDLGVARLSARIFDLQEQGYQFNRKNETSKNRYGDKVTYTRYSLKESA